jgi:hypothetical protein
MIMSEVKMKTVVVSWSEKNFYSTSMEVPADFNESQIEEAFWNMDLSGQEPQDTDWTRIDFIDEVTE